jgi:hypothetical protein
MTRRKTARTEPAATFVNADRQPDPPDPDTLVTVYPDPSLPEGSFLAGVGVDGAAVAPELAAEWIEAGLATTTPPAAPAQPEV